MCIYKTFLSIYFNFHFCTKISNIFALNIHSSALQFIYIKIVFKIAFLKNLKKGEFKKPYQTPIRIHTPATHTDKHAYSHKAKCYLISE